MLEYFLYLFAFVGVCVAFLCLLALIGMAKR